MTTGPFILKCRQGGYLAPDSGESASVCKVDLTAKVEDARRFDTEDAAHTVGLVLNTEPFSRFSFEVNRADGQPATWQAARDGHRRDIIQRLLVDAKDWNEAVRQVRAIAGCYGIERLYMGSGTPDENPNVTYSAIDPLDSKGPGYYVHVYPQGNSYLRPCHVFAVNVR